MQQSNPGQFIQSIKQSFFRGVAFGAGILTTSLFAAAAAMNVFSSGQTISASQINQNFLISAPEGAVVAFNLANCPDGWAPADGTNGTADLRGNFIRGLDSFGTPAGAAGRDPSGVRALAAYQDDRFQGHVMTLSSIATYYGSGPLAPQSVGGTTTFGTFNVTGAPADDGTNGSPRIANETRPENIALMYCQRKN